VKAKAESVPRPVYSEAAKDAQIEGKVRVELTIDPSGAIAEAKVLAGLGHGLDEAAVASLRQATFHPATRCGAPVSSTFVVSVRFAL
jgi:protein TonB